MSKLFYDIQLSEVILDKDDNIISEIEENLPHHNEIKAFLPDEWDKCNIHTTFTGILKDKIESTRMTISKSGKRSIARVTIIFKQGIRLNKTLRQETWDQMDGQITDGFGEFMEYAVIPNVDTKYRLMM